MQSFDGKIRVGPKYQALIPPFCRPEPVSKRDDSESHILGDASPSCSVSPRTDCTLQDCNINNIAGNMPTPTSNSSSTSMVASDFLISK